MRRFKVFNLLESRDIAEYETLVNDDLCTILEKELYSKNDKFFDENGRPTHSTDVPMMLVHWEKREL